MVWLHKSRKESENERIRTGLPGVEWLKQVNKEADKIMRGFDTSRRKSKTR
jgi:hypothetical protein